MAKRRFFEDNCKYHCYSRGVGKQGIFLDVDDYSYFMKLIEVLNFTIVKDPINIKKTLKIKLVDDFCFTLMPNHFHFILTQLFTDGISKFLQKVLSRYTLYFNQKYKRTGTLFESRFKDKYIDSDSYFIHLVNYIWNNPIKLINSEYNSKDLLNGLIDLTEEEKEFALKYKYKKFPENYFGPQYYGRESIDNDFDF